METNDGKGSKIVELSSKSECYMSENSYWLSYM